MGLNQPLVLCIGGSDPGAGAGLEMDQQTVESLGCRFHGVCAVATIQDENGLHAATPQATEKVVHQVESILAQEKVCAIKTGALGTIEIVRKLYPILKKYPQIPLVIDPVATASKCAQPGLRLLEDGGIEAMLQGLGCLATVVTPNQLEFEPADYSECRAVYLTGGHNLDCANADVVCDQLFVPGEMPVKFKSPRIAGAEDSHGTGCRLASALAAFMASGIALNQACAAAHAYVQGCLSSSE